MAIGAVTLSVPTALFGSVFVTAANDLGIWHSIATYSLLGLLLLVAYVIVCAIELAFKPI